MIVPFVDSVSGAAVYVNPDYVVSLRPDPAAPDLISMLQLRDGVSIGVQGDHQSVADKLARPP